MLTDVSRQLHDEKQIQPLPQQSISQQDKLYVTDVMLNKISIGSKVHRQTNSVYLSPRFNRCFNSRVPDPGITALLEL
jgi:hypothetical protein